MTTVDLFETFVSIQGESTYAGLSCFFVRLAGCNLDCAYCDSPRARTAAGGRTAGVDELVEACRASSAAIVEITGGEPLLQPGFRALAEALCGSCGGRPVLVETNGSLDLSLIPAGAIAIMDVKTPGSGMGGRMDPGNIGRLRPHDEVKFVIIDHADYEWAAEFVRRHRLADKCHAVLFSPAWGRLDPGTLAGWLLKDALPVRLQVQLHKLLGLP